MEDIPPVPVPFPLSNNVEGVCSSPLNFTDVKKLAALSYKVPLHDVLSTVTSKEEVEEYARAIVLIRTVALRLSAEEEPSRVIATGSRRSKAAVISQQSEDALAKNAKKALASRKNDGNVATAPPRGGGRIAGSDRTFILERSLPYSNNELRSIIYSTGALLPHGVFPSTRASALRVVVVALAPLIARQIAASRPKNA